LRALRIIIIASGLIAAGTSCPNNDPVSPDGDLRAGTWGGENVVVMVEDTTTHVHVGCTNGDFPAPIVVDAEGRFSVAGSYVLRAYPIQVGPSLPAQLAGVVSGRQLTFTVAVNDTGRKKDRRAWSVGRDICARPAHGPLSDLRSPNEALRPLLPLDQ
jgi:hypothetical protein